MSKSLAVENLNLKVELERRQVQLGDLIDLLYDGETQMSAIDWRKRAEEARRVVVKQVARIEDKEKHIAKLKSDHYDECRKIRIEHNEILDEKDGEIEKLKEEYDVKTCEYLQSRKDALEEDKEKLEQALEDLKDEGKGDGDLCYDMRERLQQIVEDTEIFGVRGGQLWSIKEVIEAVRQSIRGYLV